MASSTDTQRVFNFSAGPAVLPVPVLEQVQAEMLCLPGAGCSLLEISHRDKAYDAIHEEAIANVRELLSIPEGYRVLFLQGGSRLQFSMIPMNLKTGDHLTADYLITGSWGKNAAAEARKVGDVNVVWDGSEANFNRVPTAAETVFDSSADYVHFTSNETIQGVQFADDPDVGSVPLVCDASSEFLSRPLDISKYGLIYACAQKNAGPAGLTVVVVREDLVDRSRDDLPGYLSYKNHAAANSLFNTPPTFAIYVLNLVTRWLRDEVGGLKAMQELNKRKANALYNVIDSSNGFYLGHAEPDSRSVMNVAFRMETDELDKLFLKEAAAERLTTLKGHRSVGGIRASIYNAMPEEGVNALAQFMLDFASRHAS